MIKRPGTFVEPVSTRFWYHSLYFGVLERMEEAMRRDEWQREAGAVPFVLTSGAALECILNDHIVMDLWEIWFDDYKPIVEGFLSMGLRGKLDAVVPLLTAHEYRINTTHKTYQALVELVSHRNRLTHSKTFFEEVGTEFFDHPGGGKGMKWPDWYLKKISDISFGMTVGDLPYRYFAALKDLQDQFFSKYQDKNFSGNSLIVSKDRKN